MYCLHRGYLMNKRYMKFKQNSSLLMCSPDDYDLRHPCFIMDTNSSHVDFNVSFFLLGSNYECLKRQRYLEQHKLQAILISAFNIAFCFMAMAGNTAVLLAIVKTRSLHLPAYILLASLALTDFAVGFIAQPAFALTQLTGMHNFSTTYEYLCKDFKVAIYFLCTNSFFTVTAIGLDRLIALQLHMRYASVMTIRRAILAAMSITSCVVLLTGFWHWKLLTEKMLSAQIGLTLLSNLAIYLKIYFIVRRHQIQIHQFQRQVSHGRMLNSVRLKKTAVNTFQVFVLMACCYTPHMILMTSGNYSFSARLISSTIILLNSSLNPLMCCWRLRDLRSAVKQLFHH